MAVNWLNPQVNENLLAFRCLETVELIQNQSRPPLWTMHGRSERARIKGDKADLIAFFKQLKDCPVEGLDFLVWFQRWNTDLYFR